MSLKRRDFVSSVLATGLAGPALAGTDHNHRVLSGPLASATVSFGAWPSGGATPLDRIAVPNAPGAPNVHQLLPNVVTIREGGSVNFVIAGFHVVAVYGPGTKPGDINAGDTMQLPTGPPPPFPPAINDSTNRVYRGINPFTAPQDRVEVVQFSRRGTYLVICAFLPHFLDEMWGFVRVIP